MNRIPLHATGIALLIFAWTFWPRPAGPTPDAFASAAQSARPEIVVNDNREPAGRLTDGVLELELEIVEGRWHLLGNDQPAGEVLAFAERGKAPSNPGPLIRVPQGTEVHVTVTNPLDTAVVIHGLGACACQREKQVKCASRRTLRAPISTGARSAAVDSPAGSSRTVS
jgi:FtsP/CotA-like multicopper oxidase with cupredoxin domain